MSSPRLQRWAALAASWAVAVTAFALAFTRVTSPDLGFHLATGRAVLALGHLPATNVLSFAEPDHPWILHEWIPAVLFELAWRQAGASGVLAIKLVVIVATWSLVVLAARRLGASPIATGVASLLGAGAASTRFSERPQIFSNLALAGVAVLLASAARAEAGRPRARLVVAAAILAALTAQVHAGAVTSFVLLAAVAVGLWLEPWRARLAGDAKLDLVTMGPPAPAGTAAALRIAAATVGAVALAAGLLMLYHPHGARPLLVPFQLAGDADLREHVFEFRSPFQFPFNDLHLYWIFAGLALALVLRARRLPATLVLPFVVFGAISLRHVRTVDSFAIVAAPVVAVALDQVLGARLQQPRAQTAGILVLALLAVGLPIDHWRRFPSGVGIAEPIWPAPMFHFIEEQHLVGPAFVSDGWAGPFLGTFYPRERVFFDPRFEAYSPEFVHDVYRSIRYGEPGWEEKLDKYGVQLILLKYTTPGEARFQGGKENLRQLLVLSPAWALVGFGDTGEIFVRLAGPNAGVATRFGIPGVEPDRLSFLGKPANAAFGLVRAVDSGFHDNRVLAMAAVSVAAAGNRPLALKLIERADAQNPGDKIVANARIVFAP